ncbi:MAG: hypothetical protein EHM28_13345, partial [Spirochaetaceae bacterium]
KTLGVLLDVAKKTGRSPAQTALRWVIQRPFVTSAIIGARTIEHLRDNHPMLIAEQIAFLLDMAMSEFYFAYLYYLLMNAGTICLCLGFLLKERSVTDYSVSDQMLEKYRITAREATLFPLIMRGLGNKQIAYELSIKLQTVKQHMSSIFRKTGTQSRFELMNMVISLRLGPVKTEYQKVQ